MGKKKERERKDGKENYLRGKIGGKKERGEKLR